MEKNFPIFFQGLLVIAPLAITIYSIYWIVSYSRSAGYLFSVQPIRDIDGNIIGYQCKELWVGICIILVTVITIGYLSSYFIKSKIFNFFDPGWSEHRVSNSFILQYRDFFGAFAGDKKKFNKAVLANVFTEDVWIVGFLTDEEMKNLKWVQTK